MSDEDTTRIITRKVDGQPDQTIATTPLDVQRSRVLNDEEPHTKIFRPGAVSGVDSSASDFSKSKFSKEPVVGWLVVTEGPGRGQSLEIGYGMNSIGRDTSERVSVDFGDEQISRKSHALITYDTKGRKFYIQHGGGVNLTYVAEDPVLQTRELKGREIISIGDTKLTFVPFCGPDFEW
jgi:hypothetical protein